MARMASGRHRAVTLIESVLFIAIALGLIVGGLVIFQQARIAAQTRETVQLVRAILAESRARLTDDTYVYELDKVLVAAGAVPGTALNSATGGIRTPWGGDVTLEGGRDTWPAGSVDRLILLMDLSAMPRRVCARVAAFDADGNGILGDGIERIWIDQVYWSKSGRQKAFPNMDIDESAVFGLDPGMAGVACSQLGDTVDLGIFYSYR